MFGRKSVGVDAPNIDLDAGRALGKRHLKLSWVIQHTPLPEQEHDLVEVKGIAVWILNVLVNATRHRWRNRNGGPTQRLWWTFTQGKGREGQRMAIGQWAPPAADENTIPWLLAKTPLPASGKCSQSLPASSTLNSRLPLGHIVAPSTGAAEAPLCPRALTGP